VAEAGTVVETSEEKNAPPSEAADVDAATSDE